MLVVSTLEAALKASSHEIISSPVSSAAESKKKGCKIGCVIQIFKIQYNIVGQWVTFVFSDELVLDAVPEGVLHVLESVVALALLFNVQVIEDLVNKGVQVVLFQQTVLQQKEKTHKYAHFGYNKCTQGGPLFTYATHLLNVEECIKHVAELDHLELAQILVSVQGRVRLD